MATEVTTTTVTQVSNTNETGVPRHTVARGETLWALAGQYYDNPWGWARIWEANKTQVENPDRIYPDQVLVIPEIGATVVAVKDEKPLSPIVKAAFVPGETQTDSPAVVEQEGEETETAAEDACPAALTPESEVPERSDNSLLSAASAGFCATPSAPPPAAAYSGSGAMIVPEDWEIDGIILGEKNNKILISHGDTVFINIGSDAVKPGARGVVYRRGGKAKDPEEGFIGYRVRRIGAIVVTSVEDKSSVATVTASSEPIENGDMVQLAGD